MELWQVLQAKPHKERQVAVQLHQRGLSVYLPLMWVSPTNPRAARERPYFQGYFFAQAGLPAQPAGLFQWSPGLKQVVEFDGQPATVADDFVAELRQRLEQVRAVARVGPDGNRYFEPLEIPAGPFAGFEGIFYPHLSAAKRTHILLTCIQRHHWQLRALAAPRAWARKEA